MTTPPESSAAPPPAAPKTASPRTVLVRLAAVAVILAAMVAAAHFLRNPTLMRPAAPDGAGAKAPAPRAVAVPAAPREGAHGMEGPLPGAKESLNDLRRTMAGLVLSAAEAEDEETADGKPLDAEARRRFIADRFALPFSHPKGAAPADVAPPGAQILMVMQNPDGSGNGRMTLVRLKADVSAALADFQTLYAKGGWAAAAQPDPRAQPDAGWLLRFTRGREERIIYIKPRQNAQETLAAVYDSRY